MNRHTSGSERNYFESEVASLAHSVTTPAGYSSGFGDFWRDVYPFG